MISHGASVYAPAVQSGSVAETGSKSGSETGSGVGSDVFEDLDLDTARVGLVEGTDILKVGIVNNCILRYIP
jgi:hypothetical protein